MSLSDGTSVGSSDLFLTEIDAERKFRTNGESDDLLVNVRKDHLKVREVVNAFRGKVDRLIDKQRHEYIQAYESHMQDVQKELHSMRDKVFDIANDDTKNERTEKLKFDLDKFKDEAIQLETDADELRIVMSTLVRKIYSVERSRDWMLKKLRQAKRKYNSLIKEKVKLLEVQSQTSISNDSSYTIEMKSHISSTKDKTKTANFNKGFVATAYVGRNMVLPAVSSSQSPTSRHADPLINAQTFNGTSQRIERFPTVVSGLVATRTSHEEIKEFVRECSVSLHRRPWCKVQKRNLTKLLNDCRQHLESGCVDDALVPLACELVCLPELYEALNGLLVFRLEKLPRKRREDTNDVNKERLASSLGSAALLSWEVN